jgi:hypothetical protein
MVEILNTIVFRNQRRTQLMKLFDQLEEFPSIWQEEGRLALPRLLFIFRDNRVRSTYTKMSPDDLSNSVRVNLLHLFNCGV